MRSHQRTDHDAASPAAPGADHTPDHTPDHGTENHGVDHLGNPHDDRHDRGLEFDVRTLLARRRVLGILGGLGAGAALAACGTSATSTAGTTSSSTSSSSSSSSTSSSSASSSGTTPTAELPDETAVPTRVTGPTAPTSWTTPASSAPTSPAASGPRRPRPEGIPLTINLTVTDAGNGYSAMEGAAVYLWHCNRDGQYSMYSQGVSERELPPGRASDQRGRAAATYTSIFPAAYDGRWPHIHFEVYSSVDGGHQQRTDRQDLTDRPPRGGLQGGLRDDGLRGERQNLAQTSLTRDMVFGNDGGIYQLATVTGNATDGYVANLTIGV